MHTKKIILSLLLGMSVGGATSSVAAEQPNVVFILADDLGIGGLHCYGTDWLETPNLDQLCAEGMKFTNGYASHSTCQPSRIAILSGQYAPRTGGYRVMEHHRGKEHLIKYIVPKLTGLPLETISFGEQFKGHGYATAMYGKWHAGNYRPDLHPRYHSFDEAFVSETPWTIEGGQAGAVKLLEQGVTGIVCGNDLMAMGVVSAARTWGAQVPGDISVIGFDGSPMARFTDPPLTTLRQPAPSMARAVASLLVGDQRSNESIGVQRFRAELVIGRSTGRAPA